MRPAAGDAREVDAELARAATRGGCGERARGGAGAAPWPLPAATSGAKIASTAPTSSVSPGCAQRRCTTPVTGHGITTIALSVWISTRS